MKQKEKIYSSYFFSFFFPFCRLFQMPLPVSQVGGVSHLTTGTYYDSPRVSYVYEACEVSITFSPCGSLVVSGECLLLAFIMSSEPACRRKRKRKEKTQSRNSRVTYWAGEKTVGADVQTEFKE